MGDAALVGGPTCCIDIVAKVSRFGMPLACLEYLSLWARDLVCPTCDSPALATTTNMDPVSAAAPLRFAAYKRRLGTHFRTWASLIVILPTKLDILTLYQTGIHYPILYLWRPAYTQPKLRIIIGPYPNRTEVSRLSYSSTQENAYVPPADGVSTIYSPIGFLPRRMAGCCRS